MHRNKTTGTIKYGITYNLDFPYTCKICNKEIKSKSGLGTHIKNQHKEFTYKLYLLKYENIDIEFIEKEWLSGAKERKQKQLEGFRRYQQIGAKKSPKDRMTEEQYEKWKNSMSKVFTLDWFIQKYGEELGKQKYQERSDKISKQTVGHNRNKNNHSQCSKVSQELFWELYKQLDFNEVYFMELNHEYSCGTAQNFDFVVVDNKKVIEFNGDKWHANPKLFEENDIIMPGFLNMKAKQIWQKDILKQNKVVKNGYEIKIIWESDYYKNKEKVILECINFLYN